MKIIKGMQNNTELSDRHKNLKLAILLLFLLSPQQNDVIKLVILISMLNLWLEHQFLSSFSLPKLPKDGEKRNFHHVWSFMNILMIKNCV